MKMKIVSTCCLILAMVACATGTAFAKTARAKAPLQRGNGDSGANLTELPVSGTAWLKRTGNTVTVKVKMKHGLPNSTYEVQLFGNGVFCEFLGVVFEYTTNAKGNGGGSGSMTVGSNETAFFVDPESSDEANDTPYVSLP